MPRPRCEKKIMGRPRSWIFKPAGIPARELEEQILSLDEFEALRLSDRLGLYQVEVAKRMEVSRATVGRLLKSARGKVARALVCGHALVIDNSEAAVE